MTGQAKLAFAGPNESVAAAAAIPDAGASMVTTISSLKCIATSSYFVHNTITSSSGFAESSVTRDLHTLSAAGPKPTR
jgi:hypothetical protein